MSTILERLEYGFDRDSRRTWRKRTLTSGEDQAYGYDGLSQVMNAARGNLNLNTTAIGGVPAEAQAWDYDPTGNWRGYETKAHGSVVLEQTRVHDKGNRLTQIEGAPNPVLLDRAGRMREVSPDAGGNWSQSQKVKWDAWSRVVRIESGGTTSNYAYDGLTRRTTQSTDSATMHTYYSDAWRPLEERRDSQTVPERQYYWGARHRDDLVRRDRATTSGGPLNETRYVLMDYFSPAAITDGSGVVKERYAFSAFGVRRILAPDFTDREVSECDFTFAFQGQFLDSESGFYNYGYRYYSPHLGRWLSKDPIAEQGGLNLYDMVANGALNAADYLGLLSLTDGVDSSLDEFTKRLLGPCGCKIGGDIPPLTPPPPPRTPPATPPKSPDLKKPDDPNKFRKGKGRRFNPNGPGGSLPNAQAITLVLDTAKTTDFDRGGKFVDQRYVDTAQGTIDLKHVLAAGTPFSAMTIVPVTVAWEGFQRVTGYGASSFAPEDLRSNAIGARASDSSFPRFLSGKSFGSEASRLIMKMTITSPLYGR
jgi:RHS repeat-associated protein